MTMSKATQASLDSRPKLPTLTTSELLVTKTSGPAIAEIEKLAPVNPPPPPPRYTAPIVDSPQSQRALIPAPVHSNSYEVLSPNTSHTSQSYPVLATQEPFKQGISRCNHRETRKYGVLGIVVGVFFFPIGLICTRWDSKLECKRCGMTLHRRKGGYLEEQAYREPMYHDYHRR